MTYRTVGGLDSLGSGVLLTVYRIVQESLTNALRHAGTGTAAEVDIIAEAGEVRIRVVDTGIPHGAPSPPKATAHEHASGHGLVGIRQRAALYGGTVIIGPRDTGHGWVVDVVLEAMPAPEASGELLR